MQYRKYLAQILTSLGGAVVSERYLKILHRLSFWPNKMLAMKKDAFAYGMLRNAINVAHHNIKWIKSHYRL